MDPGKLASFGPIITIDGLIYFGPDSVMASIFQINHRVALPFGLSSAWCLVCKGRDYMRNLVDPASSHMLVLKIKPCMSKYKHLYSETANGSLNQL